VARCNEALMLTSLGGRGTNNRSSRHAIASTPHRNS
jgi:hypothetical protein